MRADLERVEKELGVALEWVHRLAAGYTNEEWLRRPAEGSWSASECLEHLNLTSEAYLRLLPEGLERARTEGGTIPPRYRRDLLGWLLWRTVGPKGRFRAKTTASFVPREGLDKAELVEGFERLQMQLIELLRSAAGVPLHRVKVASPFAENVKYSLYSAFTILAAHEHRHLGQAQRALEAGRVRAA